MADNSPKLGKLIEGEPGRDAVHIAVAPVTAGMSLCPGDHVGLVDGRAFECGDEVESVGIVDPFLGKYPQKGERFYLFLYPGSVTSLRHVWTHPAFSVKPPRSTSGH